MPVDALTRGRARALLPVPLRRLVRARVRAALAALARARSSVTLVFTDDDEIRALNRRYRKLDRATDVLSFHLQELHGEDDARGDGVALGDVVISVETARRRAGGRRLGAEMQRLAVHGLCHLFGHDHHRPGEARRMFALERRLRRLPVAAARRILAPHASPSPRPVVAGAAAGRLRRRRRGLRVTRRRR